MFCTGFVKCDRTVLSIHLYTGYDHGDGDGNKDLAITNYLSNNLSVLMGSGSGTFASAVTYTTNSGPFGIASGDFDSDGKNDLAVSH